MVWAIALSLHSKCIFYTFYFKVEKNNSRCRYTFDLSSRICCAFLCLELLGRFAVNWFWEAFWWQSWITHLLIMLIFTLRYPKSSVIHYTCMHIFNPVLNNVDITMTMWGPWIHFSTACPALRFHPSWKWPISPYFLPKQNKW